MAAPPIPLERSKALVDFQYALYLMIRDSVARVRFRGVLEAAGIGDSLQGRQRADMRRLFAETLRGVATSTHQRAIEHLEATDFPDRVVRGELLQTLGGERAPAVLGRAAIVHAEAERRALLDQLTRLREAVRAEIECI